MDSFCNLTIREITSQARAGNVAAMIKAGDRLLGFNHYDKLDQAVGFYRQAADEGSAEAQYKVGVFYSRGRYGRRNIELAAQYFLMAAEQGYAGAHESVRKLMDKTVESGNEAECEILARTVQKASGTPRAALRL